MKVLIKIQCGDASVAKFQNDEGEQYYEIVVPTGRIITPIKSELTDLRDVLNKLFASQS